jgi:hypothetical protein
MPELGQIEEGIASAALTEWIRLGFGPKGLLEIARAP